jgi:hypothetical protein
MDERAMNRSHSTAGERIIQGLEEALLHARGESTAARVTPYIVRKGARRRRDGIPEIFRTAQVRNGWLSAPILGLNRRGDNRMAGQTETPGYKCPRCSYVVDSDTARARHLAADHDFAWSDLRTAIDWKFFVWAGASAALFAAWYAGLM